MDVKKIWWWWAGGASTPAVPDIESTFGSSLVFHIPTNKTKYMYKEVIGALTNPVTHPSATNDPVTFSYLDGNPLKVKTANTAPVFDNTTGRCAWKYTRASSNIMRIVNSKKILNKIHDHVFSLLFWVKLTSNTDCVFFDNQGATAGTRTGMTIYRANSDGKLSFSEYTAGTLKNSGASSNSFTLSDGWIPFLLEFNGNGTNTGRIILGSTTTTFNISSATVADSFLDACMGGWSSVSGTFYLDGYISDPVLVNRAITPAEWTFYQNYNPVIDTTTDVTSKVEIDYDLNNINVLYKDTSFTTPATTNGDAIFGVKNAIESLSNFGSSYNINLIAGGAGTGPIYTTNLLNGLSGLVWDGVDDVLSFPNLGSYNQWEEGGEYTQFIVIQSNRIPDKGSEFLSASASSYDTITGGNYGTPHTDQYVVHNVNQTAGGVCGTVTLKHPDNSWNIVGYRRTGSLFEMFDTNGISSTVTNPDQLVRNNFGGTFVQPGWEGLFSMVRFYKIIGRVSNTQLQSILNTFKSTYGIS